MLQKTHTGEELNPRGTRVRDLGAAWVRQSEAQAAQSACALDLGLHESKHPSGRKPTRDLLHPISDQRDEIKPSCKACARPPEGPNADDGQEQVLT